MLNLSDTHFTKYELSMIDEVRTNFESYEEMILSEKNRSYRADHIEQINEDLFGLKSMMLMKEFAKILNAYKINADILNNGDLCCPLFVQDFKQQSAPDADYLFSLMVPSYSGKVALEGTKRN